MIIFTFETATIEPIDRLSLFPISSPLLPLVPPPPRQWILIIRPVYKAEHSPINQRVTTRLIARNTRPLIAAIYSSYRPIQIHSRGATPFNPPRRASRCAKLPYRRRPPSLSLSLSLSLSSFLHPSFRASRVLQAGQHFRIFANVCEWIVCDYIDLQHHLFAFLFLNFVIGSRGNFLDFIVNVGSIFNFSEKKYSVKLRYNFKF